MAFIDYRTLEAIPAAEFRSAKPYPWVNPQGALTEAGFFELQKNLPDLSLFKRSFGRTRDYGQRPHDRFELIYGKGVAVPAAWGAFLAELSAPRYRSELARLLGVRKFSLRFQWHYAISGCSLSPHCDAANKYGSHIFYFNTGADWNNEWGGKTVLLNDHHMLSANSAPEISDFEERIEVETFGNRSLLFLRTPHSWHALEPLTCPDGAVRKIFIVVVERPPNRARAIAGRLWRTIGPWARS